MSAEQNRRPALDNPLIVAGLRISVLESILHEREQELLEVKGPCSFKPCTLHFAHRGPCKVEVKGE